MKATFSLLTTLLLTIPVLSAPTKRATSNLVTDGSFENIDASYQAKKNFQAGGWTFKNQVSIDLDFKGEKVPNATPYGKQNAVFWNQKPKQEFGTISQKIGGLQPPSAYLLSYAYRKVSGASQCTLRVTLGSQALDNMDFEAGVQEQDWTPRSLTFIPIDKGGLLKFEYLCTGSDGLWEFDLDDISIALN